MARNSNTTRKALSEKGNGKGFGKTRLTDLIKKVFLKFHLNVVALRLSQTVAQQNGSLSAKLGSVRPETT